MREDPRLRILRTVGYALWQLQELETALATFLVLRYHATRGIGFDAAAPLVEAAEARTMGSLLRDLKSRGALPDPLGERLEDILKERNWLVHRSRRESRGFLVHPAVQEALIARLERIADEALALLRDVSEQTEESMIAEGLTRERLEELANDVARRWGLV